MRGRRGGHRTGISGWRTVGAAIALVLATAAPAAAGTPGPSALAAHGCDFDDDGFDDLALGVPGENISGAVDAGAVNVLYGRTGTGLDDLRNQVWSQSGVIEGGPEAGDAFGASLVCGDFNGDGVDDLAVGVPREDVGTTDAGAVNVIYGRTRAGLVTDGNEVWSQSGSVAGSPGSGDLFGTSLAAGDFDDDVYDDLAIGVPGEDVTTAGTTNGNAGAVNVLYGGDGGLGTSGNQLWNQDTSGIAGTAEGGDAFGASLASGDFDDDAFVDLAVGVPTEKITVGTTGFSGAGAVNVLYGSNVVGLTADGDQVFSQNGSIIGSPESWDTFGASLAVGDFDNDDADDLAIGVPREDLGDDVTNQGAVNVLYGIGGSALSTAGNELFTQEGSVQGTPESGDAFGWSLAAGDFDNDNAADLAVGVPGEDLGDVRHAGSVNVLYGVGGSGLGTGGNRIWHQDQDGIDGVGEEGDTFGSSQASGDFDGDGFDDLAIGAPGETLGDDVSAGSVNVLYGNGPSGLAASGTQLWSQKSNGVDGVAEDHDRLSGEPASSGVYRIGFTNGTSVKVGGDYVAHTPIDRIDMNGTPKGPQYVIVAAADGTIRFIVDSNSEPTDNNNYVWIEHANGEWTKYTHFETDSVTDLDWDVGDHVDAGDPLGFEGDVGKANGEHLHFEVAVPDDPADPITGGGFIIGQNRIPLICDISGNILIRSEVYTAGAC